MAKHSNFKLRWNMPWRVQFSDTWGPAAAAGNRHGVWRLGRMAISLSGRLRRTGERNLEIAFPEMPEEMQDNCCEVHLIVSAGCSASLANCQSDAGKTAATD